MLFFSELDADISGKDQPDKLTTKGTDVFTQLGNLKTAFDSYVANIDPKKMMATFKNISEQFTTMEDSAMALQRSMGGAVVNADGFRQKIQAAVFETDETGKSLLDMNLTFKDGVEFISAMAKQMGRMVSPSTEVTKNALTFSRAANMSATDTGTMIVDFSKFGGTQLQAIKTMSDLGKSARRSGLDAKSFTTEVAKNLQQASRFGFKNGIEDLEKMVKKTKLLGTSLEKLQIKGSAEKLLDPETAMETAASLQMIGGNIGALGDPFQLLYMGQKDMKKLTDEVLNMAKATFTFDKTTGAFTQTTEDMYALRAQAEALGVNYEEAANAGKELAKVDFVKSSTKLAQKITDEDTQNLVAGLSQISKDGKVTIDLPGLDKKFDSLDQALDDKDFNDALLKYQENAAKSDKDLALEQMSIAEKQAADVNVITHMVARQIAGSPQKEKDLIEAIRQTSEEEGKILKDVAEKGATPIGEGMVGVTRAGAEGAKVLGKVYEQIDFSKLMKDLEDAVKKGPDTENNENNEDQGDESEIIIEEQGDENNVVLDGIFPSGDKPKIMSRGKIYEGLSEDSVYVGTDFEKIFSRAQNATNVLSEVLGQKNTSNITEVSGKVDFGALTVKIEAPNVDTSQLEKTLNSKQFTDHIMNMVNSGAWDRNQGNIGK